MLKPVEWTLKYFHYCRDSEIFPADRDKVFVMIKHRARTGTANCPVPIIPRAKIVLDTCPAPGNDLTNGSRAFAA